MTKKAAWATTAVFLAFIFFFFALNLILPDKEFSERENKYLQAFPTLTWERLRDGDFTADFEDYCAEQFAFRDGWITLNARFEQLCGQKETNGVYLCADERLIEPFAAPGDAALAERAAVIESFAAAAGVPVTLALVPDTAELYGALLPEGAPNDAETAAIETVYVAAGVNTIDMTAALTPHADEYIFYRTDHHWTTRGAFYGAQALRESWGLAPRAIESYSPVAVTESFYGTAYSASGYTWVAPDTIERFVDAPAALQVFREGAAGALYHEESLTRKDKYTYFLGGNTPLLTLRRTDASLPSLLIVRDSFADCLAPFLLEDFGEIHLMDLRYYLGSAAEYVRENGIDRVLILYSVRDFCADNKVLLLAD